MQGLALVNDLSVILLRECALVQPLDYMLFKFLEFWSTLLLIKRDEINLFPMLIKQAK
jgi:hypothetical protein